MVEVVAVGIGSYLIGSTPSGLIIGRLRRVDIRQYGSGNIGTTNVLRTLGAKFGAIVLVADVLKGVTAVLLTRYIIGTPMGEMAAGFAAVAGHDWSLFLKFKGGRGVATSLGGLLPMAMPAPMSGVTGTVVFIVVVLSSRYVSLGSIVGSTTAVVTMAVFTLTDWMDANSEVSTNGAEDEYYMNLPHPLRCANRPLSDIGELAWIKGFDASIIKRLQPFVSVLPESNTALNVNFAPPEVLAAALPGQTLQDARQIVIQIKTAPFKNSREFLQQLPGYVSREGNLNLSVSSQYFMVTGYATQGDGASATHALLKRNGIWSTQVRKSLQ